MKINLKEYFKCDTIIEQGKYVLTCRHSGEWSAFVWGYGGVLDYLGGGTREQAEEGIRQDRGFSERCADAVNNMERY